MERDAELQKDFDALVSLKPTESDGEQEDLDPATLAAISTDDDPVEPPPADPEEPEEPGVEATPAEGEGEEPSEEPTEEATPSLQDHLSMLDEYARQALQQPFQPSAPAPAPAPAPAVAPAPAPAPAPVQPPAVAPADWFTDEELEAAMTDPVALRQALQRVAERSAEMALQYVPQAAMVVVQRQNYIRGQIDKFYAVNHDLQPVRNVVAHITRQVEIEHPDWQVPQVLDEAEKRTRAQLTPINAAFAKRPVVKGVTRPAGPSPTFVEPGRPAQRTSNPKKLTGMAAEIDAMMNL